MINLDFYNKHLNSRFIPDNLPSLEPQDCYNWIYKESLVPWIELQGLDIPYKEILEEAKSLKNKFVKHRSNDSSGWFSLCIHGMGSELTDSPETYGVNFQDANYVWTDISKDCPITTDYFKNKFPAAGYARLRFMLVTPGGYIIPHSDSLKTNLGTAINISLNNPIGCDLVTTAGTLPFKDSGSAFIFNNFYQHMVYNNSNEDRYHIIVHGVMKSTAWVNTVVDSYKNTWGTHGK